MSKPSLEEFAAAFTLTELTAITEFMWLHVVKKDCGYNFKVMKTSSGIGTNTVIHCKTCGKKKDVTDVSVW